MWQPMLVLPLLFQAAAGGSTRALGAQAVPATGVLIGVVRDSLGNAVPGASVTVRDRRVETNALGAFRMVEVPAGTNALRVRRVGYLPLTMQVTMLPSDTLTARLTMTRVVTLDSIDVAAARSGIAEFEERRAQKVGHFISRAEFARYPTRRVADFLGRVPGLRILSSRSRGESFATSGRGPISMSASPCYTQVYLDDFPVYRGPPHPPFNLNSLAAVDVEGIEYYRGGAGVPAKYNSTGSACGVLVVWTRR